MRTTLVDLLRALRWRRPAGDVELGPDPFETLAIQYRLSSLAVEIRSLQYGGKRWARGFHLVAATAAYDGLLCDAARMSGIPVPDTDPPVRKLILEAELRHQGWNW